jgi:hypothetical protein
MESATRALLVIRHEVDDSLDKDDFDNWYFNEHFAENLRCPGFLAASRFELAQGSQDVPDGLQKYLTIWELDSEDALQSPEYLKRRENPTERNKQMRTMMKNVVRAVYVRMAAKEPAR